ncbi:uncharacterized protein RHOBADRAFT_64920 [Rhodotorula graminis WP1]|uniref:Lipid droplet-associated perilipin protein n=1 Tax=Rhodotorula graminis (strain WP1) TaxID=578459 RepID=A0A194S3S6_RHOGW|nr:uncharacterized protein RHOBADRAFT_64920 [Rhodotorula graminis WP1]KPV75160.1 hypothetical protein RHOBADRAFT_64920 [Rhodotorula graminis WP1]
MSAATEQAPSTTINGDTAHETALHRVTGYPLVKDTLSTAHAYVEERPYLSSLYARAEQLSLAILHRLEPLQKRLIPLDQVDSYANAGLDYLEKRVPQVKLETNELLGQARKPADAAYGLAQDYNKAFQQRFSPLAEPVYQRLADGRATLVSLQDRLAKTIADFPHDKQSLQSTLDSLSNELEAYVDTAKSLPSHAQETAKPYLAAAQDVLGDVTKELQRTDVPLGTKASNVLHYSQDKLAPVLDYFKTFVVKKKDEASDKVDEVKDKADEASSSSSSSA